MEPGPVKLKAVLLGNSGVGKTSFVFRVMSIDPPSNVEPTVGVNHHRKLVIIEGEQIDVQLWDTAGQEQFQALTPLYCHSASCALIVTACDDLDSFDSIPKWIEFIDKACDRKPPMILVVNKCDRTPICTPEEVSARYDEKFDAICFVSALTGESVEMAFLEVAQAGYRFVIGPSQQTETVRPVSATCC